MGRPCVAVHLASISLVSKSATRYRFGNPTGVKEEPIRIHPTSPGSPPWQPDIPSPPRRRIGSKLPNRDAEQGGNRLKVLVSRLLAPAFPAVPLSEGNAELASAVPLALPDRYPARADSLCDGHYSKLLPKKEQAVKGRIPEMATRRHVTKRAVRATPKPRAPRLIITPPWLEAMAAELEERKWSEADLARELTKQLGRRVDRVAIWKMKRQRTSHLVEPICTILTLPRPEFLDLRDAEVVEMLRDLRRRLPDQHDRLVAQARLALSRLDKAKEK
jgi:hypothetical protein